MIAVVGSSNVDYTVYVPKLPSPGETVMSFRPVVIAMGGKGTNQALAARRCGSEVGVITKFGGEAATSVILDTLRNDGVDLSHSVTDPAGHTGCGLMTVNENDGVGYTTCSPGANLTITEAEVTAGEELIAKAGVVLLQLEISEEGNLTAARLAKKHGCTLILNPAPYAPMPQELISLADYVTPNETEAALWTGLPVTDDEEALAAARRLKEMGAGRVILTLGSRGCLYYEDESSFFFTDSFRVKAVDSTGAGDAFSGGLAHALEEGSDIREALRFACAVAALSVTKAGAGSSMPYLSEVEEFLLSQGN